MGPVRLLAYLLLVEEGLAPRTISTEVGKLKHFASWLLSRTTPVVRYDNVIQSSLVEYVAHVHARPPLRFKGNRPRPAVLGKDSVRITVRALTYLYIYRDRLSDGLKYPPTPIFLAGSNETKHSDWIIKTEPLSEEDHQELLNAAVSVIQTDSANVIPLLKKFVRNQRAMGISDLLDPDPHDELLAKQVKKCRPLVRQAAHRFVNGTLKRIPAGTPLSVSQLAREAQVSTKICNVILYQDIGLRHLIRKRTQFFAEGKAEFWDRLVKALRILQAACFVIIATSTGMRFAEILSLAPGCLVKKKLKGDDEVLYWIRARLEKTSSNLTGEECFWLCGELAADAIQLLEKLHRIMPSAPKANRRTIAAVTPTLFRAYVIEGAQRKAIPLLPASLYSWLSEFVDEKNLNIDHVHPHQFRRSFARNIIRWTDTPIVALQRHFKHCSLLMTDYYIGIDDQLVQMYYHEQKENSRARIRQILKGECAGPGGRISHKRLMKMADTEDLPINFSGRERAGTIEKLVAEICDEGVLAYKCGDFTTCLYVPGVAECGTEGPKAHECHPRTCPNSHILLEDVPFYLTNIRHNHLIYCALSSQEKAGPHGVFLQQRIREDIIAIEPLLTAYREILNSMSSNYDRLDEPLKTSPYGDTLKNRIHRDHETLLKIIPRYRGN
jgi:integrase